MTEIIAKNLSLTKDSATLLQGASFTLKPRQLIALLGPNGAGKTSLIRTTLGLEKRSSGTVSLGGTDSEALSPMERARRVAYLPQQRPLAWPNSVRDVVALGRFAYGAAPGRLNPKDAQAVNTALELCDLTELTNRHTDTLSGGEVARVHCARAFAAEAPLLIADEPVAALDPRQQFRIMDIIQAYVDRGGGALVVLHDIPLAAKYASHLIWMQDGRIAAEGPPEETLTVQRMADIYGVRAHIDGRKVEIEGAI